MIRKSIAYTPPTFLMPDDKRKCTCIATFVIVQCIIMFIAASTIMQCLWSPQKASFDFYKLASIMYLYDKKACGYSLAAKSMKNMQLSNDTRGLNVLPIKWQPALVTVSTRLSAKTRKYINLSIVIHVIWMILAIAVRIATRNNRNTHCIHLALTWFFYSFIFVVLFDLSMGIVYVAHIKQSLTKSMIVRYSGWSVLLKLENSDDFAGWLPMIASACWMRGVFVLGLNIYCCHIINHINSKMNKQQIRGRFIREGNLPIPEAKRDGSMEDSVLYYRPGELKPYVKKVPGKYDVLQNIM